jgi:hypothetical protein
MKWFEEKLKRHRKILIASLALAFAGPLFVQAQTAEDDPVGLVPIETDSGALPEGRSYSPYAQRSFPTRVY